jgi:hypothetical protein
MYNVDDVNIDLVSLRRWTVKALWESSKPLTAIGVLMIPVIALCLIGLVVDPRIITGMPAWLKPAKFAISISIYTLTLAWIFRYLPEHPRLRSVTGWGTAAMMVIEIGIICIQAARGTTSHFNVGTPFDTALWVTMGTAIMIVWFASIAILVALFRQKFTDPVMGWAVRMGVLITVLGAAMGGLMTSPTSAQRAEVRATHHMLVSGAHTVGAPDGGPGIPGTGWSREHGDLRVPHFFGLHAMQILPLIAAFWRPKRAKLMIAVAGVYALFFLLVLAQALAGRPFWGGLL